VKGRTDSVPALRRRRRHHGAIGADTTNAETALSQEVLTVNRLVPD